MDMTFLEQRAAVQLGFKKKVAEVLETLPPPPENIQTNWNKAGKEFSLPDPFNQRKAIFSHERTPADDYRDQVWDTLRESGLTLTDFVNAFIACRLDSPSNIDPNVIFILQMLQIRAQMIHEELEVNQSLDPNWRLYPIWY